jgi:hypothetical protein
MAKKLTKKDIRDLNERLSKFFERIAELVFAGIILSGILKENVGIGWLILGGGISVVLLLTGSYMAFRNSRK